jgi:hypothetical protein
MRRILVMLTLALVVFFIIDRQRIYLRDPLGVVYHNDVKQEGARVFINYSNDVLVQTGDLDHMQQVLVQSWSGVPGVPDELKCLQQLACLSQADHAPMVSWPGATTAKMTNRQVSYVDGDGTRVRIVLR